jgi:hypothetical protein
MLGGESMKNIDGKNNRKLNPLFDYIKNQLSGIGLWIHDEDGKQTLQFFKDKYEGSNPGTYHKKEPFMVIFDL